MTLTTFFIILILLGIIVTVLGLLTIRVCVQMAEQIYFPVKQETKKRYQRKSNTNATKRIPKSIRKV